jgi:hypothetical protein
MTHDALLIILNAVCLVLFFAAGWVAGRKSKEDR